MGSPEILLEEYADRIRSEIPEEFSVPLHVTITDGCEALSEDFQFNMVLHELVCNCVEKDADGIEVSIHIGKTDSGYTLVVEDNVSYSEECIDGIVRTLHCVHPKRFGKRRTEVDDHGEFPMGISLARTYFGARNGTLAYRKSDDNRIIAEAYWDA